MKLLYLLLASALALVCLRLACLATPDAVVIENREEETNDVPIEIAIGGPMVHLTGRPPVPPDEGPWATADWYRIEQPTELEIELPDGHRFGVWVKYASVVHTNGYALDVNMLPFRDLLPFGEAVAAMEEHLWSVGVLPDEKIQAWIDVLPDDMPNFDPENRPGYYPSKFRTGLRNRGEISYDLELLPAIGGWFIRSSFSLSPPRRNVLSGMPIFDPATASTRPATGPSDEQDG